MVNDLTVYVLEVATGLTRITIHVEGDEKCAVCGPLITGVDVRPLLVAAIGKAGWRAAILISNASAAQARDEHESSPWSYTHSIGLGTSGVHALSGGVHQSPRSVVGMLVRGGYDGPQPETVLIW